MGYRKVSTDDVESAVPEEWGGMWFLKDALGTDALGVTVLELEPGGKNKPHDHADDGQEEVYLLVEGPATLTVDGEAVEMASGDAVRVDPGATRRLEVGDEGGRLVVAGAP
jgi:quercetin dioxygenase-like cupin family protein